MEKNINAHNADVAATGHYAYTDPKLLSARLSTTTIQEHIEDIITKHIGRNISILDVGAGDGTFTDDLYKRLKTAHITAIEPAQEAVKAAGKKYNKPHLTFAIGNAYDVRYKKNEFDLVLLRSVLHHLYEPQKAIKNVTRYGKYCLIVEPNGYSPILKIIEKISPYHRHHEERSFFPHTVRVWMKKYGFECIENRFINLVPTFAPDWVALSAKQLQPVVEKIPLLKHLVLAQNITLWEKK